MVWRHLTRDVAKIAVTVDLRFHSHWKTEISKIVLYLLEKIPSATKNCHCKPAKKLFRRSWLPFHDKFLLPQSGSKTVEIKISKPSYLHTKKKQVADSKKWRWIHGDFIIFLMSLNFLYDFYVKSGRRFLTDFSSTMKNHGFSPACAIEFVYFSNVYI